MKKLQPFEILRNKQREIDEEILAMRDDAQPVCDGVADEAAYLKSPKGRVMWLLKEPYDNGGDFRWSIVKDCFMKADSLWEHKDGIAAEMWRNKTWQMVASVMEGFRKGKRWDELPRLSERKNRHILDNLKSIAWVNVSKTIAKTESSDGGFVSRYKNVWREIVLKQIEILDPRIIVCARTFMRCLWDDDALKFPPLKGSEWRRKGSFDGVYRFGDKDTFVIDAYHPGRKGLTYANDLIGVMQQIHSKL